MIKHVLFCISSLLFGVILGKSLSPSYKVKTWIEEPYRYYKVPAIPLKWKTSCKDVCQYIDGKYKIYKIKEDYTMTFELIEDN